MVQGELQAGSPGEGRRLDKLTSQGWSDCIFQFILIIFKGHIRTQSQSANLNFPTSTLSLCPISGPLLIWLRSPKCATTLFI